MCGGVWVGWGGVCLGPTIHSKKHSDSIYSLSWQYMAGSQSASQSRVGKNSTFLIFPQISIIFSYFSSNLTYFLPHFGPLGGRVANPGRLWLCHWYIWRQNVRNMVGCLQGAQLMKCKRLLQKKKKKKKKKGGGLTWRRGRTSAL